MKQRTTPLGALLGTTALAAAAPETMGPAAKVDRRLMSPDTGHGHSPLHPAQMANPARGMSKMAADVLGAGLNDKIDAMAKGDNDATTGHLQADTDVSIQKAATGAVIFNKQS